MGACVRFSLAFPALLATAILAASPAAAISYDTTGKAVAYAMPVIAAGITI
jgi:hypothetical protein